MSFNLKTIPLAHQNKTVEFALRHKFIGDFSQMGTGKSLSALATICRIKKRALIVCPPYLVNNWLHEIHKHTDLVASPHFVKPNPADEVTVISYTQLDKCAELFKAAEVIVADEGHYLKNLHAKRTTKFHSLMLEHLPEYFLYLTGTPIQNRIPEIYSMLMLFSMGPNKPHVIDRYPSLYTFCCRFTNVKSTGFGEKFEGMKNVPELRQYINPFCISHKSDEVLNLPELRESSVVVSYQDNPKLKEEFEKYLVDGISAGSTFKRDSAVATAPFTAQLAIEAVESGEGPVVVFSDHTKPLEIMALELSNLRVAKIDGNVPVNNRQALVDRLNRGQIDVLLCTTGSASSGLNMTGSSLILLNDPPWRPGDLAQLMKRIHRLGQTKPCRVVHVFGSKVSEYIYQALTGKQKVINKVLEGV